MARRRFDPRGSGVADVSDAARSWGSAANLRERRMLEVVSGLVNRTAVTEVTPLVVPAWRVAEAFVAEVEVVGVSGDAVRAYKCET